MNHFINKTEQHNTDKALNQKQPINLYNKNQCHNNSKIDELILKKKTLFKNMFSLLILPKIKLTIYYNKFKTSNLIISNNSSPSTEFLDRTNVVYMFKCPMGNCFCNENNMYVGLTTMTLSRRLTIYRNDSRSIALHLKSHSIPNSKFRKILVEKTTTITREINKLRLQIIEAQHIKNI